MALRNFLVPAKILSLRQQIKEKGVKQIIREMGWKVIVGVFIFYLVRDVLLYIVIPFLIARGLLSSP